MPDIRLSPGAWFDAMDVDRTGDLDLDEVLGALAVVLPIDRDKLEALLKPEPDEAPAESVLNQTVASEGEVEIIEERLADPDDEVEEKAETPPLPTLPSSALWRQWDKAGTGRITRQAFEEIEIGLLVWILARLKLFHRGQRPFPCLAAAASLEALGKWFDFWDWSQVGFLTRGQITRAIAREFEGRLPDLKCLDLVQEIWRKTTEEALAKPVTPRSRVVTPSHVPDEEPDNHLAQAHADPWNLREGICSRGDFLEGGLGFTLRVKLLEATAERSAAGRHRKTSKEMHSMFSFEEALVAAAGSGSTGTRLFQSLTQCANKRLAGEPEPLINVRLSQSALSVDAACLAPKRFGVQMNTFSVLEQLRSAHEDIENIEKAMSMVLMDKHKNSKSAVTCEHALKYLVESTQLKCKTAIDIYQDRNGMRTDDINALAGQRADKKGGANEATSSSLQSFVKSLANPQRSTALVIALSFMAVGVQAWEEEVLLSRMLLFLGVLLIPAAVSLSLLLGLNMCFDVPVLGGRSQSLLRSHLR
eukprot:g13087.t1